MRNYLQSFDRFVTLSYKGRFLKDRLGLDVKSYAIEFVRDLNAIILPGSARNQTARHLTPRFVRIASVFTIDGDASLPLRNRLLWGGDLFYEWVPELYVNFPQSNPQDLPIGCPLEKSGHSDAGVQSRL